MKTISFNDGEHTLETNDPCYAHVTRRLWWSHLAICLGSVGVYAGMFMPYWWSPIEILVNVGVLAYAFLRIERSEAHLVIHSFRSGMDMAKAKFETATASTVKDFLENLSTKSTSTSFPLGD